MLTILVLGIMTRTPIRPKGLREKMWQMRAKNDARDEMKKLASRTRVETVLSQNLPPVPDSSVRTGEEVLMYRLKKVGKWVRTYAVMDFNENMLTLDTGDRTLGASVDKVKIYNHGKMSQQVL